MYRSCEVKSPLLLVVAMVQLEGTLYMAAALSNLLLAVQLSPYALCCANSLESS